MKIRIFSLALILMLVVTLVPAATAAAAFSDVADSDLTAKLGLLQTFDIVGGYPDGTYRPENLLTRAEFTKLTVALLGKTDAASAFGSFTFFGDVPSGAWYAPFVNYASRELKLVNGYTDGYGSFKPDNNITYAESVTIVMRALGYADADVGFRWPEGYMERAASLGLTDGLALSNNQNMSRANGASLFYNALYTAGKDGKKLIDSLTGTPIYNVLVVSVTATATDGTRNCVRDSDGKITKTAVELPASLIGKRADFSTNKDGDVIGYELLEQTRVTIAVNYCDSEKITALDGTTHKIPETVKIFDATDGLEGDSTTYSKIRAKLSVGEGLELVYRADDELDYVLLLGSGSERGAQIVGITTTASTLRSSLRAPADTPIYKNGALVSTGELAQNDVATYNPATEIISVCNFRLNGMYDMAYPNADAPTAIQTLGNRFELSSAAAASLADFKIGGRFTLLFTSDGKVARAVETTGNNPIGLYTGKTVEFINGPTLDFTFTGVQAGELIYVTASGVASRVSGNGTSKTLNLDQNTLGTDTLAPGCAFFERVGSRGAMSPIDRDDITQGTVASNKISFVIADAAGRPTVIVFDDVTGDRYIYGELSGRTQEPSGFDVAKNYITVKNSTNDKEYFYLYSTLPKLGWGGVALDVDGSISATNTLTKYTGMKRADFIGSDAVMIDGVRVLIPDNVQIYLSATGKYMSIDGDIREAVADARAFGTEFEAYMEKSPADGGKVRVLVVK